MQLQLHGIVGKMINFCITFCWILHQKMTWSSSSLNRASQIDQLIPGVSRHPHGQIIQFISGNTLGPMHLQTNRWQRVNGM